MTDEQRIGEIRKYLGVGKGWSDETVIFLLSVIDRMNNPTTGRPEINIAEVLSEARTLQKNGVRGQHSNARVIALCNEITELRRELDRMKREREEDRKLHDLKNTCCVCAAMLVEESVPPHCTDCVVTEEHEQDYKKNLSILTQGANP